MKTIQLCIFLIMLLPLSGFSQTNAFPTTGNAGVGTTNPVNGRLEIRSTADSPLLYIRQDKNNGGSGDVFFLRDDRGYAGVNSGTTFKVESWRGLGQQGGVLANFTTIDNGFYKSRLFISNDNGNIGIGTTTPNDVIDIKLNNANLFIGVSSTGVNNGYIGFRDGTTNLYSHAVWLINTGLNGGVLGGITNSPAYNQSADYGLYFVPGVANNWDDWQASVAIKPSGNVGIGTINPDAKLTVKGTIHSEEVKVDLNVPAPDYVFEEDYELPSLSEVAAYIRQNRHLPDIPSGVEIKQEGIDLGEMNMLLLKKVEEMTLYMIEQNKRLAEQAERIATLEKQLNK